MTYAQGASQTEPTDSFSPFHLLRAIILEYGAHQYGSPKVSYVENIPKDYTTHWEASVWKDIREK